MTASQVNDFYITREIEKRMGIWNPRDEEIHPELMAVNPSIELNETQQFGFSVLEHDIHALCYTWYHPNSHLISTGVMVAQGIRPIAPAIDIMDYRGFVSADELKGSFLKYTTPNNYSVEVIEPGVKFRTTYLDKERNNSFDVVHTALHPPCLWSSNVHFEQPMRNVGEVVIRGKRYDVDGTQTRDRSWAEMRSEAPRNIPPVGWVTGIFDNGFCFHVTAFDSEDMDPCWKGHFTVPAGKNLRFGWVIVEGKQAAVRSVRKRTTYDRDWMPATMELELTDEHGRSFAIKGHVTAGFPFNAWHNCRWPICLTRWVLDGTVAGYGDIQDGQWGDFLLAMS